VAGVSDLVWSAQATSPGEVEAALRGLLVERHADDPRYVPARVLNLVAVVDREWSGEVANRLRAVGRYHPSRTIVCALEPGRTSLDAVATLTGEADPAPGSPFSELRETVVLHMGERHLSRLASIVDPIVIPDLATLVWSPHGHPDAVGALLSLAGVVLVDSLEEPDLGAALARASDLSERAYVVDLAWLRSTPWRERIAVAFDPPALRPELHALRTVAVRHHPESAAAGVLLLGWLGSRLGWRGTALGHSDGALAGTVVDAAGEVALRLEPVDQEVRGLAGLTVETAAGNRISLDRGAGGLAVRRETSSAEGAGSSRPPGRTGTMLGASRGEAGILGEGIRQALLRDPSYPPALACAVQLVA
jgi:hypothetical protein